MSASNLRSPPLSLLAAISGAALLFVLQSSEAAIVAQNSMFQGQVVYSEESGTQTSFGDESGRVCTSVIDYESSDNDDDVSALYPLNFSYPFILSNLNGSTVQESYEHVRWETNGCVYLGQLDSVSEEYDACQPGKSKQAMNSTCGIQEYEYFWAEEALEDSSFSYTNGDKAVPPIICPTQTDLAPDYGGWYSIHHCNDMTYVKSNQIAHIDFSDYVEDYGEACVFNWEVGFFKDGSLEIRFFDMCTVYQDTGESQGAVTISGGNLSNPINVCGPNCTCWDGWGGDYRITVANSRVTESPTVFCRDDNDCGSDEYCYCSGEEEVARRRRKLRANGSKGGSKSGRKASSTSTAKKGRHSSNSGGFGGHSSAKTHHRAGKRNLLFTADSCYCVDNSQ
mmetsp:Transcript_11773/g.19561  ORF Transcript_11773/g.19561 Transcript_11773/m.19561 type:complete len:395 (+) Transcript_11773:103-1287(+)